MQGVLILQKSLCCAVLCCAVLFCAVHDSMVVMCRVCRSSWMMCDRMQSCLQIRKLSCIDCNNKTKIFKGTVLSIHCSSVLRHAPWPNIDDTCFANLNCQCHAALDCAALCCFAQLCRCLAVMCKSPVCNNCLSACHSCLSLCSSESYTAQCF